MSKRGKGWMKMLAGLACLGLLVVIGLMTAVFVTGKSHEEPAQTADAIVVLGARVMPDGELSTTLLRRVEKAYEVYAAGLSNRLIVCGARGADEPVSEAAAMAAYFVARGVPRDAIWTDDESFDTLQNLQNARAILNEHGGRTALVVTSDYHVQRALWLASDIGLPSVGVAAKGPDLWHNRMKARFRESLAWVNYALTKSIK